MTNLAIKAKLLFALKSHGFNIHRLDVSYNQNGSYTLAALVTNEKPSETEEEAIVIKEDYRIRQTEEATQGTPKK